MPFAPTTLALGRSGTVAGSTPLPTLSLGNLPPFFQNGSLFLVARRRRDAAASGWPSRSAISSKKWPLVKSESQ